MGTLSLMNIFAIFKIDKHILKRFLTRRVPVVHVAPAAVRVSGIFGFSNFTDFQKPFYVFLKNNQILNFSSKS